MSMVYLLHPPWTFFFLVVQLIFYLSSCDIPLSWCSQEFKVHFSIFIFTGENEVKEISRGLWEFLVYFLGNGSWPSPKVKKMEMVTERDVFFSNFLSLFISSTLAYIFSRDRKNVKTVLFSNIVVWAVCLIPFFMDWQDIQAVKGGNGYPMTKEVTHRNGRSGEGVSALHSRALKGNSGSKNSCSKVDKSVFIQNERIPSKSYVLPPKRKGTAPGSKNKRLRIENEDSIELKLTWEEAQELLHPPPNHKPSIVVIEGHEFEEYEVWQSADMIICFFQCSFAMFITSDNMDRNK